ncbi:MAG: hypothetical protein JWR09_2374 [Mucilaginibacter sp.]|nr:hypothetical protein [Mucilaginibacter sp.]
MKISGFLVLGVNSALMGVILVDCSYTIQFLINLREVEYPSSVAYWMLQKGACCYIRANK